MDDLAELRRSLDAVDAALLAKAAERLALVERIAAVKRAAGRPLRDFRREREVLARAAAEARRLGLDPELGRRLLLALIEHSLARQERLGRRADGSGAGRRALVIGGAGRMGRWFCGLLQELEWQPVVADPAGSPDGFPACPHWREQLGDFELIVLATPIRATAALLSELLSLAPPAVVVEIASIKSPLAATLRQAWAAGLPFASIHPMFGPGVTTLAGRHLILLEGAPEAALRAVRGLFAATAVELVTMALAEHDRLMARVLVLAHALNIAFASTLAGSGESSPQLAAVASTTFARQLAIARDVVHENPALYFEIQHLAPEAAMARRELAATLASLERMIQGGDEEGFAALMSAAGRWFAAGFEAVP